MNTFQAQEIVEMLGDLAESIDIAANIYSIYYFEGGVNQSDLETQFLQDFFETYDFEVFTIDALIQDFAQPDYDDDNQLQLLDPDELPLILHLLTQAKLQADQLIELKKRSYKEKLPEEMGDPIDEAYKLASYFILILQGATVVDCQEQNIQSDTLCQIQQIEVDAEVARSLWLQFSILGLFETFTLIILYLIPLSHPKGGENLYSSLETNKYLYLYLNLLLPIFYISISSL